MQENEERFEKCLTLRQEKCPNQKIAETACYLKEKQSVEDSPEIIEKAQAYCKDCEFYEEYTRS